MKVEERCGLCVQLSVATPPADEYGGLDKWLRAQNWQGHDDVHAAEAEPATALAAAVTAAVGVEPAAHHHGPAIEPAAAAAAAAASGGYGGLGYSRLLPRDHKVVPEYNASSAAAAAANWTHTMSAVSGGFQWIVEHGKVSKRLRAHVSVCVSSDVPSVCHEPVLACDH
jgi:hypothetical protein